jgi:18S rRNA (guanine1575-N7)-methyltransferase
LQIKSHIYSILKGVAKEREVEGDLLLGDLGQGLPFRAGAFDGAISISALQWLEFFKVRYFNNYCFIFHLIDCRLCNADQRSHNPAKRLYIFFSSLYSCLVSYFEIVCKFILFLILRSFYKNLEPRKQSNFPILPWK